MQGQNPKAELFLSLLYDSRVKVESYRINFTNFTVSLCEIQHLFEEVFLCHFFITCGDE